jgi:hypothetical protein
MPKRSALTAALLEAPQVMPRAATSARDETAMVRRKTQRPANDKPLQLRLPRAEVKAIKLAAAEREQTISDFMLACFHACVKTTKKA